ncbi:hypothetical protein KIPB_002090 [Kipferlia bialata]|uniref:Uncharacterized protein n=1 Tax=Kipferlia bialata TaxID=797122 RepID=A0A9K3CS56_9EUKA|nr:hypothetical protein KIPB_002090 [Kipferlia bialata]|eukprot:g2090.t1
MPTLIKGLGLSRFYTSTVKAICDAPAHVALCVSPVIGHMPPERLMQGVERFLRASTALGIPHVTIQLVALQTLITNPMVTPFLEVMTLFLESFSADHEDTFFSNTCIDIRGGLGYLPDGGYGDISQSLDDRGGGRDPLEERGRGEIRSRLASLALEHRDRFPDQLSAYPPGHGSSCATPAAEPIALSESPEREGSVLGSSEGEAEALYSPPLSEPVADTLGADGEAGEGQGGRASPVSTQDTPPERENTRPPRPPRLTVHALIGQSSLADVADALEVVRRERMHRRERRERGREGRRMDEREREVLMSRLLNPTDVPIPGMVLWPSSHTKTLVQKASVLLSGGGSRGDRGRIRDLCLWEGSGQRTYHQWVNTPPSVFRYCRCIMQWHRFNRHYQTWAAGQRKVMRARERQRERAAQEMAKRERKKQRSRDRDRELGRVRVASIDLDLQCLDSVSKHGSVHGDTDAEIETGILRDHLDRQVVDDEPWVYPLQTERERERHDGEGMALIPPQDRATLRVGGGETGDNRSDRVTLAFEATDDTANLSGQEGLANSRGTSFLLDHGGYSDGGYSEGVSEAEGAGSVYSARHGVPKSEVLGAVRDKVRRERSLSDQCTSPGEWRRERLREYSRDHSSLHPAKAERERDPMERVVRRVEQEWVEQLRRMADGQD